MKENLKILNIDQARHKKDPLSAKKLVFISDTHNRHEKLEIPPCDFLIHTGDLSVRGTLKELRAFLKWFSARPAKYKIFIAGNHDFILDLDHRSCLIDQEEHRQILEEVASLGIVYLNDSGVELEGVRIWGSPVQPWFGDYAFNRQRGEEIKKHWDLIPEDIDILLTHGPPLGIFDFCNGTHVGCVDLLAKVMKTSARIHAFGHIHEGYGIGEYQMKNFINGANVSHYYGDVRRPIEYPLVSPDDVCELTAPNCYLKINLNNPTSLLLTRGPLDQAIDQIVQGLLSNQRQLSAFWDSEKYRGRVVKQTSSFEVLKEERSYINKKIAELGRKVDIQYLCKRCSLPLDAIVKVIVLDLNYYDIRIHWLGEISNILEKLKDDHGFVKSLSSPEGHLRCQLLSYDSEVLNDLVIKFREQIQLGDDDDMTF